MKDLAEAKAPTLDLSNYEKVFLWSFRISLIVVFLPSKSLSYILPFSLYFGWAFILFSYRIFLRLLILSLILFLAGVFYAYVYDEFSPQNFFFSQLGLSTYFIFFIVDKRALSNPLLLKKATKFCFQMFIFQGLFGIIQASYGFIQTGSFDVANGDYVEGTIHPSLAAELSFSNPLFAYNMTFLMLASFIYIQFFKKRRNYLPFLIGTLSLLLASVVHLMAFFVVAILISFVVVRPKISNFFPSIAKVNPNNVRYGLFFGVVLFVLSVFVFQSSNMRSFGAYYSNFTSGVPAKAIITYSSIFELPEEHPAMLCIGLGSGQFSSRASLMLSGLYLEKEVPFFSKHTSRSFNNHLGYLLINSPTHGGNSTEKPYYSLLTVFTEFGLLGLFFLIVVGITILKGIYSNRQHPLSLFFSIGFFFFGMCGIQEFYWEMPQAAFIGLMLLILIKSNISANQLNIFILPNHSSHENEV
ncbi:hypothetical protein [Reichenbachiella sp.]|uniref:hypothetical protein n=1 Tax=Reichenbachiella sp. TaxID=2184521 RepID=UPI003B5C9D82